MKRIGLVLAVFAMLMGVAFGQSANSAIVQTPSFGQGEYYAPAYNYAVPVFSGGATAGGVYSIVMNISTITLPGGRQIVPFATTAPILIGQGASQETVTPSGVAGCYVNSGSSKTCTVTATFANAHGKGDLVRSGTLGLQEALNDANSNGGGIVVIDPQWTLLGGTAAMVSAATTYTKVGIDDFRQGVQNSGSQVLAGSCTGTATASSTLGLAGLGEFAIGTCTSTVTSVGPIASKPGTIRGLSCSAGTGGVGAGSGVVTVLKNGSATTATCTFGTGTTCSDTTHFPTFVAGDIISAQFTTAGSETLANVKCTVGAY